MTRVGLIARAEDRGLGNMTWEFFRHVPCSVLIVDPGALGRGFPLRLDRFPGARVTRWDGGPFLDPDVVDEWLSEVDVVYSAETFYEPEFADRARAAGVRTILHAMPEFFRPESNPDEVWLPTCWRADLFPEGTPIVPVPVAMDRLAPGIDDRAPGPLRVLHVAGHRAAEDRNGSLTVLQALRRVRSEVDVRVTTQDARFPVANGRPRHAHYRLDRSSPETYWSLYGDADVLVLPRRYGGLSLPINEALGSGLVLIAPDTEPHPQTWPGLFVSARVAGKRRTPGGTVDVWTPDPIGVAAAIDTLASDPARLQKERDRALEWAWAHSWTTLLPEYRARLGL